MDTLEILRLEYQRAIDEPLFDDPALYCVLLNVIQDKIDELEGR
jgi:hypothetical protein